MPIVEDVDDDRLSTEQKEFRTNKNFHRTLTPGKNEQLEAEESKKESPKLRGGRDEEIIDNKAFSKLLQNNKTASMCKSILRNHKDEEEKDDHNRDTTNFKFTTFGVGDLTAHNRLGQEGTMDET